MIVCTGVGPGHADFLTRWAEELIAEADVVAGVDAVVDVVRSVIPQGGEGVWACGRDGAGGSRRPDSGFTGEGLLR